MKTKFTLLMVLCATTFANAQKTEKRFVQLSDASIDATNSELKTKVGLTYLVNKKNGWSNRFGFTWANTRIDQRPLFYSSNGGDFRMYASSLKSFQLNIGKEYRMPINKNIYLVAGADVFARYETFAAKDTYHIWDTTLNTYSSQFDSYASQESITAGIKPFAGVRANFGRVNLGLEAFSGIQISKSSNAYHSVKLSTLPIQAKFTIGYRMFK